MKKRLFLFMFAALTATLSALAEEYILVCNRKMSFTESWTKPSSYFNDTSGSGSVSWDAAKRKLTLDKFNVLRGAELNFVSEKTCIEVYSTRGVTIEVVGKNKMVNYKGRTLALHGNTTFTGNGTLKIGNNDDKKPGIDLLEENVTITVNGPTLQFECKNGGIRGKNNTGSLYLKAGEVFGSSDGKLVTGLANVSFNSGLGVKQPHGVVFNSASHCLTDYRGKEITNQKVELNTIKFYGIRICGIEVTESNCDKLSELGSVVGDISYNESTNKLTIKYASIRNNTKYPTIENVSNDGLTIEVEDYAYFYYDLEGDPLREALKLNGNTFITGRTIISESETEGGIYVGSGKSLSLENVSLSVPYLAGGNPSSTLNVGDHVKVHAYGSDKGTVRQLKLNNNSDCREIAVMSTKRNPRFIWNRTGYALSGVYKDPSYLATGEVWLSTKSDIEWYSLYICGHKVHSWNDENPVNEYVMSGSLAYNKNTNTLTMENVNIDYYDTQTHKDVIDCYARYSEAFNIEVKGSNIIKSDKARIIYDDVNINMFGDGASMSSLTITGDNPEFTLRDYQDYSSYTSRGRHLKLTRMTATMPNLKVSSLIVDDSKLSITRQANVEFCDVNLTTVASTPEAPAYLCIGDEGLQTLVNPKGPVNFVPLSQVTIYPITFFGEEINSANAPCLINKYVESGLISFKKTSSGYNIVLDGVSVDVDYYEEAPMFYSSSQDRIDIDVRGNCHLDFWSVGSEAYFIGGYSKSVNIHGDSPEETTLYVLAQADSNAGAINVEANCSLKINNRYVNSGSKFSAIFPRIFGRGSTSTLIIEDPYVCVGSHNHGSIADIKCQTGTNAELYNTPSKPREIRNDGIYENGSICTGMVQFVKKGGIHVSVSRINVEEKSMTLDSKGQTAQLKATVEPDDATNQNVVWTSDNEAVAKVNKDGIVTAVGNGTASICARSTEEDAPDYYYGYSGAILNLCKVTVNIPEPTAIALNETEALIDSESIGGIYLTANLTPSNADTEYIWESSDESVVSVLRNSGQTAFVRRVADEGESIIKVTTSNGLQATCKVTVHYPITPVFVDFEQRTYTLTEVGQQVTLVPVVTPANSEKLSFTWNVYGQAISLSDDGTVTALRNGSAVVECWANYDGQPWAQGEARIYVEIPPDPVIATNLNLPSIDPFYQLGDQFFLVPEFTPENVTNDALEWVSTDPNVATVDENGMVTIVDWGECFINATTTDGSNIKRSCWIQAIDPSSQEESVYATGIKLEQKEVTLLVGSETRVGVTIEPANYTESIMVELMEGDMSVAEVREEWDWNTNRTSIYIRSDEMMGQAGDVKYVIRPNAADWEKLNAMGIWEEPKDTLTIHIINPIIFAEASPEDISVTYHVTDINDKTCEVYSDFNEMMPEPDPELNETFVTPAVDISATGLLTIPARANGYWVTNVRERAFQKCSGLTEIEFSEGIATIGDFACYRRLSSLQRVTLPSTIEELGMYCFAGSYSDYSGPTGAHSNLREVNIKSFTPPTGLNGNLIDWSSAFDCIAEDAVLYVPVGALEAYNTTPWTEWFSRIEEKAFFEDQDGLKDLRDSKDIKDRKDSWFDLSGRKLGSKPAKPGLYIQNGRKFVIK